jgi:hypothetical protein
MQVLEVEEESEWSEDSQSESEHPARFTSPPQLWTKAGRTGVVPLHLNPHPRRSRLSQGSSLPFQLRHSAPTFEKSNVLVLYVVQPSVARYLA